MTFCECVDKKCPSLWHDRTKTIAECKNSIHIVLYRVDMEDICGTGMCQICAVDALGSGLFTEEKHNEARRA